MEVKREYTRLMPRNIFRNEQGREVSELVYDRQPLQPGGTVRSGEKIEVNLPITSSEDYEYLVFEDMKSAGCEPVALRSGYDYCNLCSNTELRDELVAFFVRSLSKGTHVITYELRAEIPGSCHVLPPRGFAMYCPDVYGTSSETRIVVEE